MAVCREGTGAGGSTGSGLTLALTLMVQHSPAAGPALGLVLGQEREHTPWPTRWSREDAARGGAHWSRRGPIPTKTPDRAEGEGRGSCLLEHPDSPT